MRLDGVLQTGLTLVALSQAAAVAASVVSGSLLAITVALTGLALELTMMCAVRWLRLWWLNWWRGWILRDEAGASAGIPHSQAPRRSGLTGSGGAA